MHLAASMRVVASHLHMRRATIDTARDAVIDAARVIKAGTAEPEIATLVARLEKGTGLDEARVRAITAICVRNLYPGVARWMCRYRHPT